MKYTSYRQIDLVVDELYANRKNQEALYLLEKAQKQFPNDLYEILWYKAIIYVNSRDYENCIITLQEMAAKQFFSELEWDIFDPIRDDKRFKTIFEDNLHFRNTVQKKAQMEYQVYTPVGYTQQQYPLFIALHGDAQSLDCFKSNWESSILLKAGFVVVYIQSSQAICTNGFGWTRNYDITRNDIKTAYEKVIEQYSINPSEIIIGGFSGGGIASIEITMANTIPIKGFTALCPSLKPESFSKDNVLQAAQRRIRGIIWEGEKEGEIPAEQEMIDIFQRTNFLYQFHINEGIGHVFPKDFSKKLIDAIGFITD